MLFYYLDVDFEDKCYQVGAAPDFDKTTWLNDKLTLGMAFPNLPYLMDGDEVRLTETAAIMQYLCSKWRPELLGSCPAQIGKV